MIETMKIRMVADDLRDDAAERACRETGEDGVGVALNARAGLAHLLGIGQDHTEEMVNDYLRVTRRARKVVERVFYA